MIILGWGYQPERLWAGLSIVLYTLFGSLPLLLAVITIAANQPLWLFRLTILNNTPPGAPLASLLIVAILTGMLVKSPIFLAHQ